jgi:hypothetical protein
MSSLNKNARPFYPPSRLNPHARSYVPRRSSFRQKRSRKSITESNFPKNFFDFLNDFGEKKKKEKKKHNKKKSFTKKI